jgi:hypothetical protein
LWTGQETRDFRRRGPFLCVTGENNFLVFYQPFLTGAGQGIFHLPSDDEFF